MIQLNSVGYMCGVAKNKLKKKKKELRPFSTKCLIFQITPIPLDTFLVIC